MREEKDQSLLWVFAKGLRSNDEETRRESCSRLKSLEGLPYLLNTLEVAAKTRKKKYYGEWALAIVGILRDNASRCDEVARNFSSVLAKADLKNPGCIGIVEVLLCAAQSSQNSRKIVNAALLAIVESTGTPDKLAVKAACALIDLSKSKRA